MITYIEKNNRKFFIKDLEEDEAINRFIVLYNSAITKSKHPSKIQQEGHLYYFWFSNGFKVVIESQIIKRLKGAME